MGTIKISQVNVIGSIESAIDQTISDLNLSFVNRFNNINQQIENIKAYQLKYITALEKIKTEVYILNIVKGLKKIGFEINSMSVLNVHYMGYKFPEEGSGIGYVNYMLEETKIKPSLEIRASMVGARKPLEREFKYNLSTKIQQKRFEEKNKNDEKKFNALTNLKLSINQFTLHKKDDVLLTINC